jgi:hypothetical protein
MSEEQQSAAVQIITPQEAQIVDPWQSMPIQAAQMAMERLAAIEWFVDNSLKPQVHYGTVPSIKEPFLWKPGGEMLCAAWCLRPAYTIEHLVEDLGQQMFFYRFRCDLYTPNGLIVGTGYGTCDSNDHNVRFKLGTAGKPASNAIMKRAKKRAFLDAVTLVFCLSAKFKIEGEGVPGDEGQPDVTGDMPGGAPAPKKQSTKPSTSTGEPRQDGLL